MEPKPIPYPGDTQCKGWRFEVGTEQIGKSETWLRARTGYVRAHLLLLWTEAWEQKPCGSLPNDDELIGLLLGMEPEDFAKHRAVLMRGWWVAEDGRLYHDTIVERVLDMIHKRMSNAERTRRSREREANSQGGDCRVTRDTRVTNAKPTREFDTSTRTSTRTSTGKEEPPKPPRKRRGTAAAQLAVPVETLVADGVQQRHADEWLAIRAKKDLVLTQTAWDDVKAQAAAAGMALDEAIRTAVVNSWGGFKAKWMTADTPPARASPPPNRQEAREQRNRAVAEEWAAEGQST